IATSPTRSRRPRPPSASSTTSRATSVRRFATASVRMRPSCSRLRSGSGWPTPRCRSWAGPATAASIPSSACGGTPNSSRSAAGRSKPTRRTWRATSAAPRVADPGRSGTARRRGLFGLRRADAGEEVRRHVADRFAAQLLLRADVVEPDLRLGELLDETARRAGERAPTVGSRRRAGDPGALARARDADVEQPTLLLDVARDRVADPRRRHAAMRHGALLDPDDEDVAPLEALGAVHRRQRHLAPLFLRIVVVLRVVEVHRAEVLGPLRRLAAIAAAPFESPDALDERLHRRHAVLRRLLRARVVAHVVAQVDLLEHLLQRRGGVVALARAGLRRADHPAEAPERLDGAPGDVQDLVVAEHRLEQADAVELRVAREPLHRLATDAARGGLERAPDCEVVARSDDRFEVGHRILDLLLVEHRLTPQHAVRQPVLLELRLDRLDLLRGAVEHRDVLERHALALVQVPDLLADPRRFVRAVGREHHVDLVPGAARGDERLLVARPVVSHHRVRARQDRLAAAVVLLQLDRDGAREDLVEPEDVLHLR